MTDDRVPGRNRSRTKEYECGRCGVHMQDSAKPRKCVNGHSGSMRQVEETIHPDEQPPAL